MSELTRTAPSLCPVCLEPLERSGVCSACEFEPAPEDFLAAARAIVQGANLQSADALSPAPSPVEPFAPDTAATTAAPDRRGSDAKGETGAAAGAAAASDRSVPAVVELLAASGDVEIRRMRRFVYPFEKTRWATLVVEEWFRSEDGQLVRNFRDLDPWAIDQALDVRRRRFVVVLEWRRFGDGQLMRDIGPEFVSRTADNEDAARTAALVWARNEARSLPGVVAPHRVREAREA